MKLYIKIIKKILLHPQKTFKPVLLKCSAPKKIVVWLFLFVKRRKKTKKNLQVVNKSETFFRKIHLYRKRKKRVMTQPDGSG